VAAWEAGVSGQCLTKVVADTETGDTHFSAVVRAFPLHETANNLVHEMPTSRLAHKDKN